MAEKLGKALVAADDDPFFDEHDAHPGRVLNHLLLAQRQLQLRQSVEWLRECVRVGEVEWHVDALSRI